MKLSKNLLTALVFSAGIAGFLISPASEANWYHRHHYHWAGTRVKYRGCRRIVVRRFCRIRHGFRQCYRVRRVRFVC